MAKIVIFRWDINSIFLPLIPWTSRNNSYENLRPTGSVRCSGAGAVVRVALVWWAMLVLSHKIYSSLFFHYSCLVCCLLWWVAGFDWKWICGMLLSDFDCGSADWFVCLTSDSLALIFFRKSLCMLSVRLHFTIPSFPSCLSIVALFVFLPDFSQPFVLCCEFFDERLFLLLYRLWQNLEYDQIPMMTLLILTFASDGWH